MSDMDQEIVDKIQSIYENYLKNDPDFQKFYVAVAEGEGRSGHKHERKFEAPSVTAEAEQTTEQKPKVEKERTIGDMINAPKNQEEMIISAAAKSGLMNPKELEDVGKEKATGANINKFVDKLEQRAMERNQMRELDEHKKDRNAAEKEKEQQEEKKQAFKPVEKPKPMALGEETSVTNEITKSIKDRSLEKALRAAAEALQHAGVHSEKSGDVKSQSTPVTEEAKQRKEKEAEKKLPPRDGG